MRPLATYAFLAAGLLGSLLGAGLVRAQPQRGDGGAWGHREHGGGRLADSLNLTADQKAAAQKLRDDMRAKAEPLMDQERQQMEEVETLLDGDHPDATEVGSKMIAARATREQLRALHDQFETRFGALLNADQKAKFQQLQSTRKEFGGRHHGFGYGPPPAADDQN